MPAVARSRHAKHAQTPYSRQKKQPVKQSDDGETLKKAGTTGLLENAAKGLFRMVSWVFTSGEDLSKTVSASASKAVHRSPPQRSLTSQLEDGTLAAKSESMLAPDLIPHYLGKTPKIVRARRESETQRSQSVHTFQVPKFDSASFKIPALPTPTADKSRRQERNHEQRTKIDNAPPRGRSLKALEISADTQARRDEETMTWLTSQKLTPEDLFSPANSQIKQVDDQERLQRVMADSAFFRRRGLFPPIRKSEQSMSQDTKTDQRMSTVDIEGSRDRGRRSLSRSSAMSLDGLPSDKSSITLRGRRIDSRNWQTTSSTGILAAWRDICAEQEFVAQNKSLGLPESQSSMLMDHSGRSEKMPTLWPEGISFTQDTEVAENLRSVPEVDTDVIEAGEKYWAPIRSYPMPTDRNKSDGDMRSVASTLRNNTNHRRRHSRQASNARRPRQSAEKTVQRTPRESRQQTPVSAISSHRSSSRRPTNATTNQRKQREHTVERDDARPKPVMVDSQVQTTDELMSFLADDASLMMNSAPTISKDRRKRPGCFSALDEDIEEIFGPYSDVPSKRSRLEDEQEDLLSRPRVPLLKESLEVKSLRLRHEEERLAMPPPVSTSTSTTAHLAEVGDESSSQPATQNDSSNFTFAPRKDFSNTTGVENKLMQDPPTTSISKWATLEGKSDDSAPQLGDNRADAIDTQPASTFPSFNFSHSPVKTADAKDVSIPVPSTFAGSSFGFKLSDQLDVPFNGNAVSKGFSFDSVRSSKEGSTQSRSGTTTTAVDNVAEKPAFSFGDFKKSEPRGGDVMSMKTRQTTGAISDAPAPFTFGSSSTAGASSLEDKSKDGTNSNGPKPHFTFGSAKPLIETSISTKEPSKFTFGTNENQSSASSDTATKPVTPSFTFGSPSVKATTPSLDSTKPSSGFSFDTSTADVPKSEAAAASTPNSTQPKFSFGSASQNSSPFAFKAPVAQTSTEPKFSFGSQPASTEQKTSSGSMPFSAAAPVAAMPEVTDGGFASLPASNAGSQLDTFSFGSVAKKDGNMAGLTSSAEGNNNGFSFQDPETNGNGNTGFVFGAKSGTPSLVPAQTGFSFGSSEMPAAAAPVFGQAAAQTNGTPFGQGTTQANAPMFGTSATQSATPAFGQAGAQSSVPIFGQSATTQSNTSTFPSSTTQSGSSIFGQPQPQSGAPAFGAASAGNGSTFSFGDSGSKPSSGFSFGNAGPATLTSASASGPFAAQGQPANNAFQFGAPAGQQPTNPTFAFGASAPSSGFASPAAMSPSVQTAGSPNPFNFTAAPGTTGAAANGSRKIAQPRSRKPRPGR